MFTLGRRDKSRRRRWRQRRRRQKVSQISKAKREPGLNKKRKRNPSPLAEGVDGAVRKSFHSPVVAAVAASLQFSSFLWACHRRQIGRARALRIDF